MPRPLALIIEDQPHLAILYEDTLRLVGYDVFSIHNGLEALNHLATQAPPDFVILDVNLPSLSGRDILRHIRKNDDKYKETPVLVLTANTLMIEQIKPEIGKQDYLHAKPIGMVELQSYARKVRQQLRERAESRLETQPTPIIREDVNMPSEVILPDDTIQDVKEVLIDHKKVQTQEHRAILTPDNDSIAINDEDEATE